MGFLTTDLNLGREMEYVVVYTSLLVLSIYYHNILLHCFLITKCGQNYSVPQMVRCFPTKKLAFLFFLSGSLANGYWADNSAEHILYAALINQWVTFKPGASVIPLGSSNL